MSPAYSVLTDVGRIRERNEDLAQADPRRGIYLLADGMGGHPDGNIASALAITAAMQYLTDSKIRGKPRDRGQKLASAIVAANKAILDRSQPNDSGVGMGTTLVCLWLGSRQVHIAHVGDSRAYRIRDGKAEQLTRDHTVVQALVERGDLRAGTPEALQLGHILTQAVGLDTEVRPEVMQIPVRAKDVFLLCSDGLSDLVSDNAIAGIVGTTDDLDQVAAGLVRTALEAGGHDNVTVVLVRAEPPKPSGRKRS